MKRMFSPQPRGRPKIQREKFDLGTPELRHKRCTLLKKAKRKDSSLAESLLGVFYAHDIITKGMYQAGHTFAELGYRYESCLHLTSQRRSSLFSCIKAQGKIPIFQQSADDSYDKKCVKAWRHACKILRKSGESPFKTVIRVVFNDFSYEFLNNLQTEELIQSTHIVFLQQGLGALEQELFIE